MPKGSVLAAAPLAILALPGPGATFPADTAWQRVARSGAAIADSGVDGSGNGREVVGDASHPCVYVAEDGTDFFFRIRLDVDPLQSVNDLRPFGWGLLIDADGDFDDFDFSLMISGIVEATELAGNTAGSGNADPTDIAETLLASIPAAYGSNVRVVAAESAFNATPDFFLDVAFPLADLQAEGALPDPFYLWAGSSSNSRSINVDLAGKSGTPAAGDLVTAVSDPTSLQGAVGIGSLELGPSRLFVTPPAPNPSGGDFSMRVWLPTPAALRIDLVDVRGRPVRAHHVIRAGTGWSRVSLDAADVGRERPPAGVYFCVVRALGQVRTAKLVLER